MCMLAQSPRVSQRTRVRDRSGDTPKEIATNSPTLRLFLLWRRGTPKLYIADFLLTTIADTKNRVKASFGGIIASTLHRTVQAPCKNRQYANFSWLEIYRDTLIGDSSLYARNDEEEGGGMGLRFTTVL
jgi:hypothetical protein